MKMRGASFLIGSAIGVIVLASTCSFSFARTSSAPLPVVEKPLRPEKNPPGDIPDNQVFVEYDSPLGFSIKVPEGWARRQITDGASFTDKYNSVVLGVSKRAEQLTVASVKHQEIGELEKTGRAIRVSKVKTVGLPAGAAIVVSYGSNSEPNPVTNKAIRLENDRYFFWKKGQLVTLTMSAPFGADNVDQWRLMAKSFRWR